MGDVIDIRSAALRVNRAKPRRRLKSWHPPLIEERDGEVNIDFGDALPDHDWQLPADFAVRLATRILTVARAIRRRGPKPTT